MPRLAGRKKGMRSQRRLGVAMANEAPAQDFARREGWHPKWHRLPGLFLLVLGLLMLRLLLMAPRFTVSAVEVTGTQMLAPDQIRADVNLLGRRIFDINERELERQLTAGYPCVQSATVRCRLPGRCQVALSEVSEVVIWRDGDETWWVALDGRVLGPASVSITAPVLHNSGPKRAPQDGYLIGVPWRYALAAGQALPEGESLEFEPGYGLVLYWGEAHTPVYLGEDGDAAAKLALAADAMTEAQRRGVDIGYIDLRSEARPIVGGM